MKSVVSTKGQTVIPKEVRDRLGIKAGAKIIWTVREGAAVIQVLPEDPIGAAMGALKHLGLSTADLLAERRADYEREEADQLQTSRR